MTVEALSLWKPLGRCTLWSPLNSALLRLPQAEVNNHPYGYLQRDKAKTKGPIFFL